MISAGKTVVLISKDKIYKYKWNSYGTFEHESDETETISSLLGIEIASDVRIKAAFTNFKAARCKRKKDVCAKTTLITSDRHYEATWINKVRTIDFSD